MSAETRFIPHALRIIGIAVIDVIGKTDLHVRRTPLPKRMASRASARLRELEQMLRRVIALLALAILPGLKTPSLKRPHITIAGLTGPEPIKRDKHRPRPLHAPQTASLPPISRGNTPPDFSSLAKRGATRPPSTARLLARIQTLQRILENPQSMARRLASHYARLKAARKDRPLILPLMPPRRAPAELALVAGALPMELKRALATWHDTS